MMPRPRFASFRHSGRPGWGLVRDDGLVDLSGSAPTLRSALEARSIPRLAEAAAERAADLPLSAVVLDIPVPDAEKIICVGVNYPDRNAEYKDGTEAPPNPSLFPRFARSFVGHGVPLTRPSVSAQLDYEGEIVLVIGRGGRHIAERDALDHVAGLSLANEGTVRDWVRHAKFNVTQGKNFDGSGAIGPWMVPFGDEAQVADIALETLVNGETRQRDRTSRMIFPFRRLIAYISTFTTLVPGDLLVTGTPTGAGARLDPPRWLAPGDVVEVRAEGIGALVNGIVDEAAAA